MVVRSIGRRNGLTVAIAFLMLCCMGSVPAEEPTTLVRTLDQRSFRGEIHRISVAGQCVDELGQPLAGARVFGVATPRMSSSEFEERVTETTSDDQGKFSFEVEVLILTEPRQDDDSSGVGEFCVFAVAGGKGFTWAPKCTFKPSRRSHDTAPADVDHSFFQDHSPEVKLELGPPAMFEGVVHDHAGKPLANARVQVGFIEQPDRVRGRGYWSCSYSADPANRFAREIPFSAIRWLPAEYRETRTDSEGYFALPQLRTSTIYSALIDPGPLFDTKALEVITHSKPANANARRGHYTGDGAYDVEFATPQTVEIQLLASDGQPVEGATVVAHGSRERSAGTQATSNSEGIATLEITPGKYSVMIHPPLDAMLLYEELTVEVQPRTSIEQLVKLRPAAKVLIKAVHQGDGSPIADVRFLYQTEAMDQPRPLSSQPSIFDYRGTNRDGELEVIVPPGALRIEHEPNPRRLTPRSLEATEVEAVAGEVASVTFEFEETPPPRSELSAAGIPDELVSELRRQQDLLWASRGIYTAKHRLSPSEIDFETLRTALDGLQASDVPDIRDLYREWSGEELLFSSKRVTFDGPRRKTERLPSDHPELRFLDGYVLFNGDVGVHCMGMNGQVDVQPKSQFRFHVDSLHDLVFSGPAILNRPTEIIGDEVVQIVSNGTTTIETYTDLKTGFLRRRSMLSETGSGEALWQFGPTEQPNGLLLPKLSIHARLRDGKISILEITELEALQLMDELPRDAFAAPVQAGAVVVNYHGVVEGSPGRPSVTTLIGPVLDIAMHVQRHPSTRRSIEPKLRYGEPAPPITASDWFDRSGTLEAPETKGKIVLLEFWATWCGPCVAHIDEVNDAVQEFEGQPVMVVGLHASGSKPDEIMAFADQREIAYAMAIDKADTDRGFGTTADAFGVRGIP
jgi:thiol-disulfide isomerase/thioredoxin